MSALRAKSPVTMHADDLRSRPDQDVVAKGNVELRSDNLVIHADTLTYQYAGDLAQAEGNVQVLRDGNRFSGPELTLKVQSFEGHFANPTYFFSRTQAGGTATRMEFLGEKKVVAMGATYTSCPVDGSGGAAWLLSTDKVSLDFEKNEGIAEGAVLRFYGVPILGLPALSFPLSDARKSGWLPPTTSLDNKSGFQFAVPYYWNIAPNRDATLTPTVIAKRGVGLDTQFRYLEPRYAGSAGLNLFPHDQLVGRTRGSLNLDHEGRFNVGGSYSAHLARVSDDEYWKDFSHVLYSLTPRLLAADFRVRQAFGHWTPYAGVKRWQVLQDVDAVNLIDSPYDRLPQIGIRGAENIGPGFVVGVEAEFNRFSNPDGHVALLPSGSNPVSRPVGSRLHALSFVSWPYMTPGWSVVPKVSFNAATYALDQPLGGGVFQGRTQFSRVIPTWSVDSAWVFERDTNWFGRALRQTLEPRLLYVKTPYRDQTGLPTFDSAPKDFNVDSIYTDNLFSGVDRVSDSHQLTAGLTSRFLNPRTGMEALRLGVAQRFLLQDQRVTPGDGAPLTQRVSDLLLFGSSNVVTRWTLDAALQYNPDIRRIVRSVMGARYSPGPFRTISATYRLKRGESEQFELGWQWPIYGNTPETLRSTGMATGACDGSWYSVGRVIYSLRDSRINDSVLGLEYDSGCWIGRIVAKRLSTSQQEATTQLGVELELVGLSRLGTNSLRVLQNNVPGYRMLRGDTATAIAP